jgi:CHAD domain-containing protein
MRSGRSPTPQAQPANGTCCRNCWKQTDKDANGIRNWPARSVNSARERSKRVERTDSKRVDQTLRCALGSCQAQLAALALLPTLPVFARSRIDLVVRAVRKHAARALQRGHHTNASLHAVRIEMKKLRYLLEFFSPLLAEIPGGAPKWLSMIQERLGALNDVVVSKTLVRRHATALGSRKTIRKALHRLKKREKWLVSEARKVLREHNALINCA